MRKYVYSAVLIAAVTAGVIFFMKPPETAAPKVSTTLAITFRLPDDYDLTAGAPFKLTWRTEGPGRTRSAPMADRNFNPFVSPYKLVFMPAPGATAVVLNARLYYCHKTSRMCFQDDFQARVPLNTGVASVIPWGWDITPKKQNL